MEGVEQCATLFHLYETKHTMFADVTVFKCDEETLKAAVLANTVSTLSRQTTQTINIDAFKGEIRFKESAWDHLVVKNELNPLFDVHIEPNATNTGMSHFLVRHADEGSSAQYTSELEYKYTMAHLRRMRRAVTDRKTQIDISIRQHVLKRKRKDYKNEKKKEETSIQSNVDDEFRKRSREAALEGIKAAMRKKRKT